ncbi:MAG: LytTR family DNA-binding domain-containing protein [Bacteroidia bacterium]|nr:LytTR family DNA-binding domain-containing protein [Bacteroidia bacterium]
MINAVIIEDEPLLGKNLAMMIKTYCPDIKIVALIDSGKMALDILPVIQYDLVFSDIQLGDMDAFTLFEQLENNNQHIIFITAHDEFALNAFKLDAIDYLLKPILPEDLMHAVNKALDRMGSKDQLPPLYGAFTTQKSGKILIKSNDEIHFLSPEKIIYCEADGAYTKVYLDDNNSDYKLVTTHLKKIEEVLPKNIFFRIHDALIVNCNFIDHIKYQKRICVLNHNAAIEKTQLKISERKYPSFIDFLKNN